MPLADFVKNNQGGTMTAGAQGAKPGSSLAAFAGKEQPKTMNTDARTQAILGPDAPYAPRNVDEARKLQTENPTLWGRISKNLMKPIGLVATASEELGKTLGSAAVGEFGTAGKTLFQTPAKLGGILTGTRARSFQDIFIEDWEGAGLKLNEGEGKDFSTTKAFINDTTPRLLGLIADIGADPLNFLGGGLTKVGKVTDTVQNLRIMGQSVKEGSKVANELKSLGLWDDMAKLQLGATKAEQAQIGQRALLTWMVNTRFEKTLVKGARLYDWASNTNAAVKQTKGAQMLGRIFSTKTSNQAFNLAKSHFDGLMEYRKGQAMDEAIAIQNTVAKMTKEEATRLVDIIETAGGKPIDAVDEVTTLARRLQDNFGEMKKTEESLGLLKTDIQDYFPHIKVSQFKKMTSWQKFKSLFETGNGMTVEDAKRAFGDAKVYSTKLDSSKQRTIEGTVNEINKQFGTNFFETNPAIAFAQRAMGSAKAVTSKEFFESAKQFGVTIDAAGPQQANWVATKIKGLEGIHFAPDVAQHLEAYHKAIKPEELNVMFRGFDHVQNWWKAQALVAPSYHVRNMAGNFWNNFLGGVTDWKRYVEAGRLQQGKQIKFVDDVGRNWDNATLMKAAKESGVINEGWYAKDIETAITSEMGGLSWNPMKQNFALFRGNRAVGSMFENNARLAHFIQRLKEGQTVDNAAMSVKKYLFDYGDLTWTEKNVMKRLLPFYTWTRKNIPLQMEKILTDTKKFAAIPKVVKFREDQVKKPNEKYLGDYIRDNVGIRVGTDKEGNTMYFLLGNWLPAAQAIDFLSQPRENFIMSISPFLKTPVELWSNQSTFFEDTFGQPSKIERMPEENQSWMGFTMRKKTAYILKNIRILNELDKLNPGSVFGDKDNPSLAHRISPEMGFRLPFGIGAITTSEKRGGRFTPDGTGVDRMLQSLFGKTALYNPGYAKRFYLWDTETKIRELERAIKDARRDGQKEYAKRMREELKAVKRERSK